VLVVSIVLFLSLASVLFIARHRRLGLAFLTETIVFIAGWSLARAAVESDYRDADGYVDCWPSCTVLQDAVKLALLIGPLLWVGLAVVAAVLVAAYRRRGGDVQE
jgi:hypothetical protein